VWAVCAPRFSPERRMLDVTGPSRDNATLSVCSSIHEQCRCVVRGRRADDFVGVYESLFELTYALQTSGLHH